MQFYVLWLFFPFAVVAAVMRQTAGAGAEVQILTWLPPVIISAIVSFVSLFILRYNRQADTTLQTATVSRVMGEDIKEIKASLSESTRVLNELNGTLRVHAYQITEARERIDYMDQALRRLESQTGQQRTKREREFYHGEREREENRD